MAKNKQYEINGIVHRCRYCKRGLKNKVSIARGAGLKCHNKERQRLDGLRILAARENG